MMRRQGQYDEPKQPICVGVDGEIWDISNLSQGQSSRPNHHEPTKKEVPVKPNDGRSTKNIYPSRGSIIMKAPSIRDIDNLFKEIGPAELPSIENALTHPDVHSPSQNLPTRLGLQHREAEPHAKPVPRTPDYATSMTRNPGAPTSGSRSASHETRDRQLDILQQFSRVARKPEARTVENRDSAQGRPHSDASSGGGMMPTRKSSHTRIEIEVSPGVHLPMCGAEETELAVRQGSVMKTICACCESELHCISSAEYVYCPVCLVIGPIMANGYSHYQHANGVGLGLTNDVMQEIMSKISPR